MGKYYYHGIASFYPEDVILNIIRSGSIKSKRLMGRTGIRGYNGLDYVSICTKLPNIEQEDYIQKGYNCAYLDCIVNHFCLILSKDIDVVKPHLVLPNTFLSYSDLLNYLEENPNFPVSDMFDEYQVKDMISLSKVIGIGIPLEEIKINNNYKLLEMIYKCATKLGLDIVNTSNVNFVDEYERNKKENNKGYQLSLKEVLNSYEQVLLSWS